MPFSLQVKYSKNRYKKGDVIAIRPNGFVYAFGDCLKEWLASGRLEADWLKTFAIIYVTNPEMDGTEQEVLDLIEPFSDDPDSIERRRFNIRLPADYNHKNRKEIRETGETSVEWSQIQALKNRRIT